MSPQPTAPPAPAQATAGNGQATDDAAKAAAKAAAKKYADLVKAIEAKPEGERTMGEAQILRATHLEKQRSELMEKVASNRTFLRLMAQNESLTQEQSDWLSVFYPEKEKGERRSAEDIEATRTAREAARS